MTKQAWRIKLEQRLAADGDEGMASVVDHLSLMIRVAGQMRHGDRKNAIEKLLNEWSDVPQLPVEKSEPILHLLYEDEVITIPPCDGTRLISAAKNVFTSGIDQDFTRWNLSQVGNSTPATNVSVHEMGKDAKFTQIFGSLGTDLDNLVLTQDQIIEFCLEHRSKLRQDGDATFFLFKENEQFYVAYVRVYAGGLRVRVRRFGYDGVWDAGYANRIVVPQLTV